MIKELLKIKFLMKLFFVIFETIFLDRTINTIDIINKNKKDNPLKRRTQGNGLYNQTLINIRIRTKSMPSFPITAKQNSKWRPATAET